MEGERVPCSKQDFLEQDDAIRGQKYCLVSFVSPEDILRDKEVFFFNKFVERVSSSINNLLTDIERVYPDVKDGVNVIRESNSYLFDPASLQDEYRAFKQSRADLEEQFHEENNFRTSIRGVKVRGSYDTIDEAKARCETLKTKDPKHNIYIIEVGCWCPWSPNPDDIANGEYAETELNTMMKKYNENIMNKEEFYMQRKEEMMKKIKEEQAAKKEE